MTAAPSRANIRHDADALAARYPALLVEAQQIVQTMLVGMHGRRRAGPGESFWQHRPYGFGDAASAIDWRQSARAADRYYVRENEWDAAASVYFWCDRAITMDYSSSQQTPSKIFRADVLIIALALLLSRGGERIGLLGNTRHAFHGRQAPSLLHEAMVNSPASNTPPAMPLNAGARAVFVSDFLYDLGSVRDSVRRYAAMGVTGVLLQVCDPSEEDFPFAGRTEFSDLRSSDKRVIGDAAAIAQDYRNVFVAHRAELEDIAQSSGWTFVSSRTDRPAQLALLGLYTALGDMDRLGL